LIELENAVVYHGSNLDVLPTLPDNSVDAIVTDPPYELGFMGKSWDSSGIAYSVELWQQCLRVLKPGGHLLAFGGSRTWHRIAVAIEDAGFDVRDSIAWLYGSGFPKSLDISKAIDKAAGVEREVITETVVDLFGERKQEKSLANPGSTNARLAMGDNWQADPKETLPATDEAKKWQGWGTALKPAFEPVVVARKPLVGTVAANVLLWGVGGLNIDGSRIGTDTVGWQGAGRNGETATAGASQGGEQGGYNYGTGDARPVQGRWPANIILDEHTAGLLDEQSGVSVSKAASMPVPDIRGGSYGSDYGNREFDSVRGFDDSGGASRFFYVAKASKKDRNEGLEDLEAQRHSDRENAEGVGGDNPRNRTNEAKQNFHPTVKPTALMEYLVKLVTPPGGTVLDPFTGSGSTGKAALLNGFKFIGIELTADYLPIIEGRLKHAAETYAAKATEEETKEQETLF
jgi:site-specific DNA-methyltransferase (adenine-specific)